MRYLVNRETKEHVIDGPKYALRNHALWDVVEADLEGWIKHDGGECPLPDGHECEGIRRDGQRTGFINCWEHDGCNRDRDITHYRPILDDKPEMERYADDLASRPDQKLVGQFSPTLESTPDLIDRLRASHKAACELPDIIAELREMLEPMGYDLVARSPFVERPCATSEIVDNETPADAPQDMTDWRNWREGDILWCDPAQSSSWWQNELYEVLRLDDSLYIMDDDKFPYSLKNDIPHLPWFSFHSRPTKEQGK